MFQKNKQINSYWKPLPFLSNQDHSKPTFPQQASINIETIQNRSHHKPPTSITNATNKSARGKKANQRHFFVAPKFKIRNRLARLAPVCVCFRVVTASSNFNAELTPVRCRGPAKRNRTRCRLLDIVIGADEEATIVRWILSLLIQEIRQIDILSVGFALWVYENFVLDEYGRSMIGFNG